MRCQRRASRACAAHFQHGQVLGVKAGRHGLDQLPADEHVLGELVSPYVRELPGPLGVNHRVELDGFRRLRAEQYRRWPGGLGRWLLDWYGQGWFCLAARPEQAGWGGHPRAWCGLEWL
jgi:hypothetical protein